MEVFIVSFVTGTISALTILVSGVAETSIAAAHAGQAGYLTSTAAVAAAFNAAVPTVGGWVVAFCAFLFGGDAAASLGGLLQLHLDEIDARRPDVAHGPRLPASASCQ